MSRVLQIRRGTTAENDNFTGMAGEITFDSTAKTVRVHDGSTLGGFALARVDEIPEPGAEFDITTVPDTTWSEIVARVAPAPFTVHTSSNLTISSTTYIEYIFSGVSDTPIFSRVSLVCQTDAAGYATSEETTAFGIGNYSTPAVYTFVDVNGVHVRVLIGGGAFWVAHKSTGVATNIANAEWKLKISIYC